MRRGGLAIIVVVSLALAGCSLFGKKKPDVEQPPPQLPPQTAANNNATGNGKGAPFSTTSNPKYAPPGAAGMLAGRVICNYDRQPPPTIIQFVATGEKPGDAKGQETATNSEGFFTIQGLIPGQGYQLTARTRDGDVKMGGVTFATAPNPRVLIVISEEFAAPAAAKKGGDKSSGANDTSNGDLPNRPVGVPSSTGSTAEITPARIEPAENGTETQIASRGSSEQSRIPLSIGASGRGLRRLPRKILAEICLSRPEFLLASKREGSSITLL